MELSTPAKGFWAGDGTMTRTAQIRSLKDSSKTSSELISLLERTLVHLKTNLSLRATHRAELFTDFACSTKNRSGVPNYVAPVLVFAFNFCVACSILSGLSFLTLLFQSSFSFLLSIDCIFAFSIDPFRFFVQRALQFLVALVPVSEGQVCRLLRHMGCRFASTLVLFSQTRLLLD